MAIILIIVFILVINIALAVMQIGLYALTAHVRSFQNNTCVGVCVCVCV